jgi:membrane-bound lytic murein transglycosylase D
MAPISAWASPELFSGPHTALVGTYTLDHRYAITEETSDMEYWRFPTESYRNDAHPLGCSEEGTIFISRTTAEMLKLGPSGGCSNHMVVKAEPEPEDIEACRYEGPGPFEFDLDDDGPQVMVSLGLDTTQLGSRAKHHIDRNIKVMTERIRERFSRYLSRSGRFLRLMKNILREEGVPEDIAYLPLIESGFNTHAYSRSRASGPWQFIKGTGRRYGLKINWWVDERRDPVKSTHAAARYLKDLHDEFGSWSLALAAYNAGEGKIRRALRVTKAKDFWSVMRTMKIKRETRNYVPKFIAGRMIATDPEAYGFTDVEYLDEFAYDEVAIEFPMSLDVIAKAAECTVKEIKDLNPELRRWTTPPVDTYTLHIPLGSSEAFMANLPKIPEAKRVTVRIHKVKRGDSVYKLARRYGVPQRTIIQYNKLGRRALIHPGQRLIIPVSHRRSGS